MPQCVYLLYALDLCVKTVNLSNIKILKSQLQIQPLRQLVCLYSGACHFSPLLNVIEKEINRTAVSFI